MRHNVLSPRNVLGESVYVYMTHVGRELPLITATVRHHMQDRPARRIWQLRRTFRWRIILCMRRNVDGQPIDAVSS